jgi:hypothetical protein
VRHRSSGNDRDRLAPCQVVRLLRFRGKC